MRIEAISKPDGEWDAFAEANAESSLGHAAAWARVLADAYGLTSFYLGARDTDGRLVGILPLVRFRSLRGHELVSLPFLDTAGILAETASAEACLRQRALDLAREQGVRAIELRQRIPATADPVRNGLDRVDLVLPLASDEESQWKELPAKVRNQTRKARSEGLQIASGGPEVLRRGFYEVFRTNMRDLGSPVHAERFFEAAAEHFGSRLRFIVAMLDDRPVGGLVAIRFGRQVCVPWASTLRSERRRCPNNLIYWEALRWACSQGAAEFGFGRSAPGGGTYRFKRGWGAETRSLAWTRLAPDAAVLPTQRAGDSPLLRAVSRVWTRIPVPLTALLGPRLRRFLPD
jgi:FemAB-related protein (PEP-CTERM system-associated)